MSRKIFFSVLLFFSMIATVHAGCFAEYTPNIIESNIPKCFRVETESCLGRLIMTNHCETIFTLEGVMGCRAEEYSPSFEAQPFLHDSSVDIPPDWELTIYPSGKDLSFSHSFKGTEVSCRSGVVTEGQFDLTLSTDAEVYQIKGIYSETGRKLHDLSSPALPFSLKVIIVVFIFGILMMFYSESSRRKKK